MNNFIEFFLINYNLEDLRKALNIYICAYKY